MGDRFVPERADGLALSASPLRFPTGAPQRRPLPAAALEEGERRDHGWVAPRQFSHGRPERQALHAALLEQELLGSAASPGRHGSSAAARGGAAAGGDDDDADIGGVPAVRRLPFDGAAVGLDGRPLRAPQLEGDGRSGTRGPALSAAVAAAAAASPGRGPGAAGSSSPLPRVLSFSAAPARGTAASASSSTAAVAGLGLAVDFDDENDALAGAAASLTGGSGARSAAGALLRTTSAFGAAAFGSTGARSAASSLSSDTAAAVAAARRTAQSASSVTLSPLSAESQALLASPRTPVRRISKVPFRVLDAPGMNDDFYFSLLDWSSQDVIAAALPEAVYLYHPSSMKIVQLLKHDDMTTTSVTSVAWSGRGGHLATGWAAGTVIVYDATTRQPVRSLTGHKSRVTALSWGAHVLATGGKDRVIYLRDLRSPAQYAAKLAGHRAEICGLRFSPDWQLLASGANDNLVTIWSHQMVGSAYSLGRRAGAEGGGAEAAAPTPATVWKFAQHRSAVKAMAWSPHTGGLLATGGGRDDKQIRLFSTGTGEMLDAVDTGSQVCTLAWAPGVNELASTHGYVNHAVAVWRYPSMSRVCALYGHAARVLHAALSPDGTSLVTGAADNTLRFWELFPPAPGVEPVDYRGLQLGRGSQAAAGTATLVSPMREGAARGVAEIR